MPLTEINLSALFVTGRDFKKLDVDKKAMFKLLIHNNGELTLAAFVGVGHDFRSQPEFIMTPFAPSSFNWKKNQFLGDQKIGKNRIKTIQRQLSSTNPEVIFIPVLDDEFSNQIAFRILLENMKIMIKTTPHL